MKLPPLLFIGLACMAGGGLAGMVAGKPPDPADAMAQHLGELFVSLVGVALVITHFVIGKKPRR